MEFSDKLNLLFENKTKPDGTRYSQDEVVRGTGGVLTRVYLWKLRTGKAKNPGFHIVEALAAFFDMDLNYFRTDAAQPQEMLEYSIRESRIEELVRRASKYSDETLLAMIFMMDYLERNYTGKSVPQTTGHLPGVDSED